MQPRASGKEGVGLAEGSEKGLPTPGEKQDDEGGQAAEKKRAAEK